MRKCLIVDDVEVSRFTAAQFIREFEMEVGEVENGIEALQYLQNHEVDVVLMDWHLRKESGITVLEEIRKRYGKHPKVVVLSGVESSQEAIGKATASGADGFLEKPTTKQKLEECLQRIGVI